MTRPFAKERLPTISQLKAAAAAAGTTQIVVGCGAKTERPTPASAVAGGRAATASRTSST